MTRELGDGPFPSAVGTLIDAEFTTARELWRDEDVRPAPAMVAAADARFRRWVSR